mgnify:CR=1 FL=1
MEILYDSTESIYLAHKTKDKCFFTGNDIMEFKYMYLDPDTIKTGWGMYDTNGYNFKWDDTVGQKSPQPADGWKRAFSVWVYVDGNPEKPLLWERFTYGEFEAFKQLLRGFWNAKDAHAPNLPQFKYIKSVEHKVGLGTTAIPEFEFVEFKPRPEKFQIPVWANETDELVETVQENPVVDNPDEIPF